MTRQAERLRELHHRDRLDLAAEAPAPAVARHAQRRNRAAAARRRGAARASLSMSTRMPLSRSGTRTLPTGILRNSAPLSVSSPVVGSSRRQGTRPFRPNTAKRRCRSSNETLLQIEVERRERVARRLAARSSASPSARRSASAVPCEQRLQEIVVERGRRARRFALASNAASAPLRVVPLAAESDGCRCRAARAGRCARRVDALRRRAFDLEAMAFPRDENRLPEHVAAAPGEPRVPAPVVAPCARRRLRASRRSFRPRAARSRRRRRARRRRARALSASPCIATVPLARPPRHLGHVRRAATARARSQARLVDLHVERRLLAAEAARRGATSRPPRASIRP